MSTVASVSARLTGIHVEAIAPLYDKTTYLCLRLADGQNLRVPTQDTRASDTLLNGKRALPTEYRIVIEEAQ